MVVFGKVGARLAVGCACLQQLESDGGRTAKKG